jgi:hypothetical protein|nr:MAG TPA: hypothetical protein [Caudoviricetes sp.]
MFLNKKYGYYHKKFRYVWGEIEVSPLICGNDCGIDS